MRELRNEDYNHLQTTKVDVWQPEVQYGTNILTNSNQNLKKEFKKKRHFYKIFHKVSQLKKGPVPSPFPRLKVRTRSKTQNRHSGIVPPNNANYLRNESLYIFQSFIVKSVPEFKYINKFCQFSSFVVDLISIKFNLVHQARNPE